MIGYQVIRNVHTHNKTLRKIFTRTFLILNRGEDEDENDDMNMEDDWKKQIHNNELQDLLSIFSSIHLQISERRREEGSTVKLFNGSGVALIKIKKIIRVTRLSHGTQLLILKLKRRGG